MGSVILLLSLVSTVIGSPQAITRSLLPRQSVPDPLPSGWLSHGCYTDSRGARTLNAASYTSSDRMTVESCLAFCVGKGYRLAGVEWNSECFCDQAIQSPGAPTALSECDYPCSGDASQTCGAGNRINIYTHSESPAPAVPQSFTMHWGYKGCYTDKVSSRTLSHIFPIPGGANIEFCLATCSMNGFAYAGLEFGDECFCGNTLGSSTKTADSQCTMACKGNSKQFCGGPDRLTLYSKGACQEQPPTEEPSGEPPTEEPPTEEPPTEEPPTEEPPTEEPPTPTEELPTEEPPIEEPPTEEPPSEEPPTEEPPTEEPPTSEEPPTEEPPTEEPPTEEPPTEEPPATDPVCLTTDVARFKPRAVYKSPPPAPTPSSLAITMTNVNTIPGRSYGLFSSVGAIPWIYFILQRGAVLPKGPTAFPKPISYTMDEGGTPTFVTDRVQPTGYTGYCAMANPNGGNNLLAANGHADLWSLCSNTTASGRLDLVYAPRANHPHYHLNECLGVDLEMVPS